MNFRFLSAVLFISTGSLADPSKTGTGAGPSDTTPAWQMGSSEPNRSIHTMAPPNVEAGTASADLGTIWNPGPTYYLANRELKTFGEKLGTVVDKVLPGGVVTGWLQLETSDVAPQIQAELEKSYFGARAPAALTQASPSRLGRQPELSANPRRRLCRRPSLACARAPRL